MKQIQELYRGPTAGRRELLIGGMSLGLFALSSNRAAATGEQDPLKNLVIINTLGGISGGGSEVIDPVFRRKWMEVLVTNFPEVIGKRAIQDTMAAGITALNQTIGYVAGSADPFEHSVADIARFDKIIRQRDHQLIKVLTTKDILRAKEQNKLGIIYGSQNGVMVGDNVERIDIFANLGVRVYQLTYNPANTIGGGSAAPNTRLTEFGRSVVERLNTCNVIVDLAHSGTKTCLDAASVSSRPISISHTGCRALVDLPRNKTDEELRLVANKGGYVGIYFMTFLSLTGRATADDVVRHLEHAINVCGEDHVGIGTDNDAAKQLPMDEYLRLQADYLEQRKALGIAAPGETVSEPFTISELTGPDQLRTLYRMLRQRGHSHVRIEKIFGGNYLRFAREVWGA